MAIASAAKPGAAGRHANAPADRKRGEAGRSGSPCERPSRSQARRSRAQRVAMRTPQPIASAAKPGAAGRHANAPAGRKRVAAGRGEGIPLDQLPPRVEIDNYKASYLRM